MLGFFDLRFRLPQAGFFPAPGRFFLFPGLPLPRGIAALFTGVRICPRRGQIRTPLFFLQLQADLQAYQLDQYLAIFQKYVDAASDSMLTAK